MTFDPEFPIEVRVEPMEHRVVVTLASVPLIVDSNSALVTAAFAARYDVTAFPKRGIPHCTFGVRARCGDAKLNVDREPNWDFFSPDEARVWGAEFTANVNLETGAASATVTESFVRGHPLFHRTLLEGIPLYLINRKDRHPVHGASVRQGDVAIVLCGPSGVGKSTLMYVAHRAGLEVLADDSTRVQLSPTLRVWGEGREARLHLMTEARSWFAELRGLEPDWETSDGERKLTVRTGPRQSKQPSASAVRVCLLTRDGGGIARRVATAGEIRDALLSAPEAEADKSPVQRVRVVDALAAAGGWHLNLSSNAAEAIPHLRDMLASVER